MNTTPLEGTFTHGRTGYTNKGCRCDVCRAGNSEYQKELNVIRKAKGLPPGDWRHGKASSYINWGCRCTPCCEAHNQRRGASKKKRKAEKLTDIHASRMDTPPVKVEL
jgi:hypothetical protein